MRGQRARTRPTASQRLRSVEATDGRRRAAQRAFWFPTGRGAGLLGRECERYRSSEARGRAPGGVRRSPPAALRRGSRRDRPDGSHPDPEAVDRRQRRSGADARIRQGGAPRSQPGRRHAPRGPLPPGDPRDARWRSPAVRHAAPLHPQRRPRRVGASQRERARIRWVTDSGGDLLHGRHRARTRGAGTCQKRIGVPLRLRRGAHRHGDVQPRSGDSGSLPGGEPRLLQPGGSPGRAAPGDGRAAGDTSRRRPHRRGVAGFCDLGRHRSDPVREALPPCRRPHHLGAREGVRGERRRWAAASHHQPGGGRDRP